MHQGHNRHEKEVAWTRTAGRTNHEACTVPDGGHSAPSRRKNTVRVNSRHGDEKKACIRSNLERLNAKNYHVKAAGSDVEKLASSSKPFLMLAWHAGSDRIRTPS